MKIDNEKSVSNNTFDMKIILKSPTDSDRYFVECHFRPNRTWLTMTELARPVIMFFSETGHVGCINPLIIHYKLYRVANV